jgi:hypothetical protein
MLSRHRIRQMLSEYAATMSPPCIGLIITV